MAKCEKKCEVYSRVVGYYRPVADWNVGKKEEFSERRMFDPDIIEAKRNEENAAQAEGVVESKDTAPHEGEEKKTIGP